MLCCDAGASGAEWVVLRRMQMLCCDAEVDAAVELVLCMVRCAYMRGRPNSFAVCDARMPFDGTGALQLAPG